MTQSLTEDQERHLESLKEAKINEVKTESAFTMLDIEFTLKHLKREKGLDFYLFLKTKPSARALKLYLEGLTRRTEDRVKEADRSLKHPAAYRESDAINIRDGIGYANHESDDRVIKELHRLKNKSDATWKAIEKRAKMTKKQILKFYNIE